MIERHSPPSGDPATATAHGPQSALSALLARAEELGGGRAPVDDWDPPHCGEIPMVIAGDGTWHYAGSPINRPAMVRLFASILRREPDGSVALVTPVEKVSITVEDAPFLAVEMAATGSGADQTLTVRTNVGDAVSLGPEHPLRFGEERRSGGFVPYAVVRRGLEARFSRSLAIELADHAVIRGDDFGVWSGGTFFRLPDAE